MNTCGTCKYFGKPVRSEWEWEAPALDATEVFSDFHQCELIKHNARFKLKVDAMACLEDGSGYRAVFCVKDEFGCNQWEAK